MSYHLREGVFAARSGEQIILLDLLSNRYLGISTRLSGEGGHDLQPLGRLRGSTIETLVARDMIVASGGDISDASTSNHRIPLRDDCAAQGSIPALGTVALAIFWQLRLQWELRRHGLDFFKTRIERERRALDQASPRRPGYRDIAVAFERLNPIFPTADRCLVRSLAFVALSHRYGLAPSLVLGVQFRPFSAHSWVQDGDTVLNDRLENVATFTPILTL